MAFAILLGPGYLFGQTKVYSYIDENGHRIITNIPSERSPLPHEEIISPSAAQPQPQDTPAAKGKEQQTPALSRKQKAAGTAAAQTAIERAEQQARRFDHLASSADRLASQADAPPAAATRAVGEPTALPAQWSSNQSGLSERFPAMNSQHFESLINKYADVHGLEPDLVRAVIKAESNFNPFAVSPKGARGLMQLMPDTARRYGVRRIYDPEENIAGGVKYLRELLDMFQGNVPLALSGYNAGENRVIRSGGVPNISETRNYINRISRIFNFDRSPFTPVVENEPMPQPRVRRFVNAQGMIEITNIDFPAEEGTNN